MDRNNSIALCSVGCVKGKVRAPVLKWRLDRDRAGLAQIMGSLWLWVGYVTAEVMVAAPTFGLSTGCTGIDQMNGR